MQLHPEPRPVTATDAEIAAALEGVETPPLLVAVASMTGDLSLLRDDLRPSASQSFDPTAGITPEQAATARRLVAEALGRFRDGGSIPAPPPDPATVRTLLEFMAGTTIDDDYIALMTEELAIDGVDRRAPEWNRRSIASDREFRVLIVGAGMSGIAVAHRLGQAGVDYTILEKNADVGGTWLENRYPGCRVDVPNHFYSYSFAQTSVWPQYFSTQGALLDYFRACADTFGIREHVQFDTEVLGARWNDDVRAWNVTVRRPDGGTEVLVADALVSAVGQLNQPNLPDIPGRDSFAGPSFHSARWDASVDLGGKRVAIIGTGASAAQFIPAVAEMAGELTVFQRTPPWLLETPNYHDDLPVGARWLLDHVPAFANWDRVWIFWRSHELLMPMATVDPGWESTESVSFMNDLVRQMFTEYYRVQFPDREMYDKVLPHYPPFSKRFVRDNGIWARTFARDDVTLDVGSIGEITATGITMADGTAHEFRRHHLRHRVQGLELSHADDGRGRRWRRPPRDLGW